MPNQEEAGFESKNQEDERRRSTVDVNKLPPGEQGEGAVELD